MGQLPEIRRRVVDLVEAGRTVAEVAMALGVSEQTIGTWRRQPRYIYPRRFRSRGSGCGRTHRAPRRSRNQGRFRDRPHSSDSRSTQPCGNTASKLRFRSTSESGRYVKAHRGPTAGVR